MVAVGVAVYEAWEDRQTLLAPDLGGAPIHQIEALVEAVYRACAQEASDSRKMALAQNALARKLVGLPVWRIGSHG